MVGGAPWRQRLPAVAVMAQGDAGSALAVREVCGEAASGDGRVDLRCRWTSVAVELQPRGATKPVALPSNLTVAQAGRLSGDPVEAATLEEAGDGRVVADDGVTTGTLGRGRSCTQKASMVEENRKGETRP